jgi:hypothetical protein
MMSSSVCIWTFSLSIHWLWTPRLFSAFSYYSLYVSFLVNNCMFYFTYFLLLCWWYIVAFANVLTMYQVYHTWYIHLLNHSHSSPPLPPFRGGNFNRYHFYIYYMHTNVILLYSSSYPFFPIPTPSHWCKPSTLGTTWSTFLFSDFVREKKRTWKIWHFS